MGALQGAELGRAWTVLGVSYADQNNYREAQHSFEQAISVLRTVPEDIRDYAAALTDLGCLYRVQGRLKVSMDLQLRALHLYQQVGNHSGIARVSNVLADLVLEQGRIREGKRYLKQAADEMKVATELNDDDLAAIFTTQALFARAVGNPSAEIDGCEHAIEVLKRVHKVDNLGLAWR